MARFDPKTLSFAEREGFTLNEAAAIWRRRVEEVRGWIADGSLDAEWEGKNWLIYRSNMNKRCLEESACKTRDRRTKPRKAA